MSGRASHTTMRPEVPADAASLPFDGGEDEPVTRFVQAHRHLRPLLHGLRREVDARFGPGTPVRLDLVTDPEEGDVALFARIGTALPVDEAVRRLDALVDGWWLGRSPRVRGLIHLDVHGR